METKIWPVLIGLALATSSARAERYYVGATGGNDAWDGQAATHQGGQRGPWRTMARVNDFARKPHFSSGDIIALKRGETWADDEGIRNLDASGMGWPGTHQQNIYVTGVDGLDIDGIYIDGHRGTTTYNVRSAIAIGTVKGDVTVQNCEIINIIGKGGRLDGDFAGGHDSALQSR